MMHVELQTKGPMRPDNKEVRVNVPAKILPHFEPTIDLNSHSYTSLDTPKKLLDSQLVYAALERIGELIQRAVEPGTEYTWTLRDEVVRLDEKRVGEFFAFTMVRDGGNDPERSEKQFLQVSCVEVKEGSLHCNAWYLGELGSGDDDSENDDSEGSKARSKDSEPEEEGKGSGDKRFGHPEDEVPETGKVQWREVSW